MILPAAAKPLHCVGAVLMLMADFVAPKASSELWLMMNDAGLPAQAPSPRLQPTTDLSARQDFY